jgi:hypothetical protein
LVSDIDEGTRLRVFGLRVLRKIFWPKRAEIKGEWRRLHIEESCEFFFFMAGQH